MDETSNAGLALGVPRRLTFKGCNMKTMTLSEAASHLGELAKKHGDVPLVLWDLDSGRYFSLAAENFEAQQMEDGSPRVSVGLNSYQDHGEPEPKRRPL